MLRFGKNPSTRDATVFALNHQSAFQKRVLSGRAKRMLLVEQFLVGADPEAKNRFASTLLRLESMLRTFACVSERLVLFFDNNVLQDILQKDLPNRVVRQQRFYALLAFLALAEDHYLIDVFACVSPAVMYEASGRGRRNPAEVEEEIRGALADAGLTSNFVGYSKLSDLKAHFRNISRDEKALLAALKRISDRSWNVDTYRDETHLGEPIPFSVAESECPDVTLYYFQPWYVKLLLMHDIHRRMFSKRKGKSVQAMMNSIPDDSFSVLRRKGDAVEGLGDIEMLTLCDLATQTASESMCIMMGLTFDDALEEALRARMIVHGLASTFVSGEDEPEDGARRMVYSTHRGQKRTDKANRRANEYARAWSDFIKSIEHHLAESQ